MTRYVGRFIDDKYVSNIIEPSPEGYEADQTNKYIHHKQLPTCSERKITFEGKKCCTKMIITCGVINTVVPKNICYQCNGNTSYMQSRFAIKK